MQSSDLFRGFVIEGWAQEEGRPQTPLPAYLGPRWNGFECPYFDRASTSKVIADQDALLASLPAESRRGLYRLAWDADTVLVSLIPRPGTAEAEDTEGPGRIEATLIDGTPHWNLGFGWRWERVDEHGEPIERGRLVTLAEIEGWLSCIRHSLRLERRLAERRSSGEEVIGVFAHLGDFADTTNKPIPVSVQIGTVTITARGKATLALTLSTDLPQQTHAG
jgi:hypothetical protein